MNRSFAVFTGVAAVGLTLMLSTQTSGSAPAATLGKATFSKFNANARMTAGSTERSRIGSPYRLTSMTPRP